MAVGGYCKDCFSGVLHAGEPQGKVTKLFDLDTYVAEPDAPPKAIIVIIADAFGWELTNNRVLADNFAKNGGYRVYLPDFFAGHAAPPDAMAYLHEAIEPSNGFLKRLSHGLWVASCLPSFLFHNRLAVTGPRVYKWMYQLRHSEISKGLKVGPAGYCFGGKFTFYLCSSSSSASSPTHQWFKQAKGSAPEDGEFLVDAGYTAHPSMLELPLDVENVVLPLSVASGSKDIQVTAEKASIVIKAFEKKNEADGVQIEGEKRFIYVNYEGAMHGFAVRNSPYLPAEKEQGEQAEQQAIDFFSKWLI